MGIDQANSARAGDQQAPIEIFTQEEQLQIDLYQQYWLYAIPPEDGTDLYQTTFQFIRRSKKKTDAPSGMARAKGLRANTRAIFNFVPFIISKNRELIANDADYTGVQVYTPEGEPDEVKTEYLQSIFKPYWRRLLSEVFLNGLITGNAFILVDIENGRPCFECLFSNHVFLKRNPQDIDDVIAAELKYTYTDDQGVIHSYKKVITKDLITEEVDGKQTKEPQSNPIGWIPIVQIKNIPVPGKSNGLNCFSQHISDIDEVNEIAGDWIRAVSFYGTPHLVLTGTSIDGEFKSDVGQTTELPEGGSLKYLEYEKLGDQLKNILALADAIKSKIPEFDLNNLQKGSTEMSGYAIYLKLSSLVAKVSEEQSQYEEGIAQAGKMALALIEKKKPADYDVECDLGEVLPANKAERVAEIEKLKLNGWLTDEQAMTKLGYDQAEIDAVIAEKNKGQELEKMLWEAAEREKKLKENSPQTALDMMEEAARMEAKRAEMERAEEAEDQE